MLTDFPKAVPEIAVRDVKKAAKYYVDVLGFRFDWVKTKAVVLVLARRSDPTQIARQFFLQAGFKRADRQNECMLALASLDGKTDTEAIVLRPGEPFPHPLPKVPKTYLIYQPDIAGCTRGHSFIRRARLGGNLYTSATGAKGVIRQLKILEPVARFNNFGFLFAPKNQFNVSLMSRRLSLGERWALDCRCFSRPAAIAQVREKLIRVPAM